FVPLLPLLGVPDVIAQDAESVFAAAGQRVFQILIIDTESSEKSSIGSGFLLDSSQLLVTNFHVIADAVDEPAKYRKTTLEAHGTLRLPILISSMTWPYCTAMISLSCRRLYLWRSNFRNRGSRSML
ncbi:MAG: hypothetical protein VW867_10680, partial [Gammaproteobacteria bacterium]